MELLLVCLVALFGIALAGSGHTPLYIRIKPVTDATLYAELGPNMQTYVNNIFEAKKKLDAIKGDGVFNRLQRCRLRYQIDENSLLYLLNRWSSRDIAIPTKSGNVIVDMTHNWYTMPMTHLVFMFDCLFNPNKLVQGTMTMK